MEIPDELKSLYRHWKAHSKLEPTGSTAVLPNKLIWFITERMSIWEQKYRDAKPPFTNDKALQKYRFCNIYRELDRQTTEIHTQLNGLRNDFPLWLLNVAFHRFVCKPETILKVGLLNFDADNNQQVYEKLIALPKPKYGTPYVFPISVIQKSAFPTREKFFCYYLPKTIPSVAEELEKFNNITVNEALKRLLPTFGFNFRFHWTEILIDIAYQYPNLIDLYKDFYVGPGALPTAQAINPELTPSEVVDSCVGTELKNFPYLTFEDLPIKLSAENWEGIFCEYRKYTNLKEGKGRKRIYNDKI